MFFKLIVLSLVGLVIYSCSETTVEPKEIFITNTVVLNSNTIFTNTVYVNSNETVIYSDEGLITKSMYTNEIYYEVEVYITNDDSYSTYSYFSNYHWPALSFPADGGGISPTGIYSTNVIITEKTNVVIKFENTNFLIGNESFSICLLSEDNIEYEEEEEFITNNKLFLLDSGDILNTNYLSYYYKIYVLE